MLLESTARASEPFILFRKAHGSLRGCGFTAQRANSRVNSRVNIETHPADLEHVALPDAPDLAKLLSIIWNIPLSEIVVEGITKSVPRCLTDPLTPLQQQEILNRGNGRHEATKTVPS
jgi:hypothetical protein